MFEKFGEVESAAQCPRTMLACSTDWLSILQRITKAPDGQFLKIDRRPPSEYTMVYADLGGNHFALTVSNAEDVVNHNFGIAIVTMLDVVSVCTAINMLSGVAYVTLVLLRNLDPLLMDITSIDGSVVEVKRLGGGGSSS